MDITGAEEYARPRRSRQDDTVAYSTGQRLSWNEVRIRAAKFAREWQNAHYEKGETQTFYNEFFEIFGVRRRQIASFEEPVKKLGDRRGFIDLFWKGTLLVEQKSAGRDLVKAKAQAFEYFPRLRDYELPRYILVSDFQTFELYDLEEGDEVKFSLADLPQHVQDFGFILGIQKRSFRDQDPVNIAAAELMGRNCQNWLLELRPMPDSPRVPAPVSLSRRKEVV